MPFTIEVEPVTDNEEISFYNLELFHFGCTLEPINKHRNPITNIFTLKCGCGLEVLFSDEYTGTTTILRTAIDKQQREIKKEDYHSNRVGPFIVAPLNLSLA